MSVQKQEDKPTAKHHQYDGSRLRSDIGAMLNHPAVAKKLETKKKVTETKTEQKPAIKPEVKVQPPKARVGYKKLIVTISEDLARTILNYAGHSASKQATFQVWYTEGKEPHADTDPKTVSPVYPLFNL